MTGIETLERRYARYINAEPSGCWEWIGTLDHDGYGSTSDWRDDGSRFKTHAHRAIYRRLRGYAGTLPLDHLCRNRSCVNPDHLEPVTVRENTLRGVGITAKNAVKTHCLRGHALSGKNLHVNPAGKRICKACAYAAKVRRRAMLGRTVAG